MAGFVGTAATPAAVRCCVYYQYRSALRFSVNVLRRSCRASVVLSAGQTTNEVELYESTDFARPVHTVASYGAVNVSVSNRASHIIHQYQYYLNN
jgi:hypothetical protein